MKFAELPIKSTLHTKSAHDDDQGGEAVGMVKTLTQNV